MVWQGVRQGVRQGIRQGSKRSSRRDGLLAKRSRSIHVAWMRTALGLVWLYLVAPPTSAQHLRIGVAPAFGSPCSPQDVQEKLDLLGRFATIELVDVKTSTPTLAELLEYDALVTWSNLSYSDPVATGDVFADYVDQGRGIVVASFANSSAANGLSLGGRWIAGGYEVIEPRSGSLLTTASLGTVWQPSHPIMANVFNLTAERAFRPVTTNLVQGQILAEWDDGKILAAVGDMPGRVDLGWLPPSDACNSIFWNSGGDGTQLLANALEWVATQPLVGDRFCFPAAPNSSGASAILEGRWVSDVLHLDVRQGPPDQFGYFLVGTQAADPGLFVGQGEFCLAVGGPHAFVRYNVVGTPWNSLGQFGADGRLRNIAGTAAFGEGFDVPASIPVLNTTIQTGDTWHFQAWFREASGASNFSNGLSVSF